MGLDYKGNNRLIYYTSESINALIPVIKSKYFYIAILAVFALLFLFFPSASIHLTPETKPQSLDNSVSASLDPLAVTQLVTGKSPEEAAHWLSNAYSLTTVPDIRINPSWWPWLPIVPFQINVSVENQP